MFAFGLIAIRGLVVVQKERYHGKRRMEECEITHRRNANVPFPKRLRKVPGALYRRYRTAKDGDQELVGREVLWDETTESLTVCVGVPENRQMS